MYQQRSIATDRLRTSYYRTGEGHSRRLLMLHGNLSSAAFYLPLFTRLSRSWDVCAPDLRCFGDTEEAPLDATRGYRDWSDDIYAFCRALGWKRFTLCGWSLGGNVAMQFVIDHPEMVERLVLIAPASPYGFGGSYGEEGTSFHPPGLGSGGGVANPALVNLTTRSSRVILRELLQRFCFKPPFRMSWRWENIFIQEIGKIKLGDNYYPGSYTLCPRWPFVVAGQRGVLNAMSPQYGKLSAMLDLKRKPKVLWVHGDSDEIVSDTSMVDLGYLGKLGLVSGWPGELVYPPQPMLSQTRHFFQLYKERGGSVREVVIPGGHMCALESPEDFFRVLDAFTPIPRVR